MKKLVATLGLFSIVLGFSLTAAAVDIPSEVTLIKNVNIFDGKSEKRLMGYDVLVVKNLIHKIDKNIELASTYEIDLKTGGYKEMSVGVLTDLPRHGNRVVTVYEPEEMIKKEVKVNIIDGKGRTLIPGLIDVHWHMNYAAVPASILLTGDMSEMAIIGFLEAEETLLRGFTTVRDMGGNPFAIKKLTDSGAHPGPRIFPSGPPISQTSGHFDYSMKNDHPQNMTDPISYWERNSVIMTADGVPEVILRVRENLRMGATQIKIAAGGGVASSYDDLDVQEFIFEEIKAAVDVAETWNTYVAAHIFTDEAIQTAIKAGVKSIEHGNLVSDETLKMMKEKDVWLSAQPIFDDGDYAEFENAYSNEKFKRVTKGTDYVYKKAKEIGVKMAFGTDLAFDPAAPAKQGKMLTKLGNYFTPYEALKMATSTNAELLKLCGPRNPYRDGELGVIKEGAYADMVLVDGNPLEELDLVADPETNFVLIMKDGKIYKNTL
ncbi:amidohydrolase family protein [Desulfopila sp. IMCC35008]|uniref:metal-dependent hydrolase family protein n=1 Tax=Desulfopila sp. IMCC35008 TaxID=2653858 RepID=UPI0013D479CE|nr:amidohydrolase family protein [Desulfopila sp. IMCC35008]